MRTIAASLFILMFAACQRSEPPTCDPWRAGEIELSDDQVSCEVDEDCTIASTSCCDCRSGGNPIAVNKAAAPNIGPPPGCCGENKTCLAVDNCSEPAQCRAGRCELPTKESNDVPDAGPMPDAMVALDEGSPQTGTRFDEVMFAATHNSYSGESRGSIRAQLDIGVRFIEFDVHSDEYATAGYRIGHDEPGHEVALGDENPAGDALVDWLAVVSQWRNEHPDHLPLTIGVDLKDDLFATATTADGNLAALNQLFVDTFGDALFTEVDATPDWPAVEAIRGRVLVVLSGNTNSRLGYRRAEGANPAVAASDTNVLVAHDVGSEVLVWSGTSDEFWRYQRLPGTDPAVAIDGADVVLALNGSVRTGSVSGDHEIVWDGPAFDLGADATNPAVRFIDGSRIRVVTDSGTWEASWNSTARTAAWAPATAAARPDETVDGEVSVTATTTEPYGAVVHVNDGSGTRRVRLAQRMFSESQIGGPPEFEEDDVMIYAADAFGLQDVAWAEEKRAAGHIVRLWKFNLPNVTPDPPPTFPATDRPVSEWYEEFCARCLRD